MWLLSAPHGIFLHYSSIGVPHMNFLNLEYFVVIAEELSISAAAQHLHISQQALSRHISKLEDELGTSLFVRAHPLALTKEGQAFYETAKEILRLKGQYDQDLKKNISIPSTIRIGIGNTVGRSLLPNVLPDFFASYPNVPLRFIEDAPEHLKKAVNYDGLDLVIGSISNLPKSYKVIQLCEKHQLLIVPKAIMNAVFPDNADEMRRAFSAGYADMSVFADAPFIRMDRNYAAGRIQNEYYRLFDISPNHCLEMINSDVAFQLACSGCGILIYSKFFFDTIEASHRELYLQQVDVFQLPPLRGIDTICAYYPRDRHLSAPAQKFVQICQSFFRIYNETHPPLSGRV